MFISKQFRNFVHNKSVYAVFRYCIFEVTRANLAGLRTRSNFIQVQLRVQVQPILASPSSSSNSLI